jgi:membrane associated rhomboid family serine protease
MVIIPLSGKISRRNPPFVTIAIILINCFVLFFLQSGDGRLYEEAMGFYFNSGLARIETARYIEYISVYGNDASAISGESSSHISGDELLQRYMDMQQDRRFMKRLESGGIITPDDEIYAEWRDKRNQFESILGRTVTMRYGFIPEKWSITSAFSYMFLHGGFMHLLGNMIFLWLVGCVLELAWGRLMYVGLYVAGGLFAVMLYGLVYTGSTTPLVGASGAIAGLIGAYAVLYGKRKIKVFYSLGFYFNYTMVPALIVLPLWIGNEFAQLFFGSESHVAYMAHIGGLASGALMGLLNTKFIGRIDENVLEDDPREKIPRLMEEALGRIEKLDMDGARPILDKVLEIDPNNRDCLTHIYNMEKLDAGSPRFHDAARKLLNNLLNENHVHKETLGVYQEYIKSASQPRLPLGLLFRISSYFAATGHVVESEKIVGMILRKSPYVAKLPEGLLHIARACIKEDLQDKARKYLQVICLQYPGSSECGIARRLLEDMGA